MNSRWYVRLEDGTYLEDPATGRLISYYSEAVGLSRIGPNHELVEGPIGAVPAKLEKYRRAGP